MEVQGLSLDPSTIPSPLSIVTEAVVVDEPVIVPFAMLV